MRGGDSDDENAQEEMEVSEEERQSFASTGRVSEAHSERLID